MAGGNIDYSKFVPTIRNYWDTFDPLKPRGVPQTGVASRDLLNELQPYVDMIARDYQQLGAITPETRAKLQQLHTQPTLAAGKKTNMWYQKAAMVKEFAANALRRIGGYATWDPRTADPTAPVNITGMGSAEPGDFMRQYVSNLLLPYMDVETAAATRNWLFRTNPETFRRYEAQQYRPPGPLQAGEFDPNALKQNLQNVSQQLDWDKFHQTGVGQELVKKGGLQAGSAPMAWMKQYLQTAASGVGGTRAEQRAAQARLLTLRKEMEGQAQVDPNAAQFLTVAENLVNPFIKQQQRSGLLGQGRAVRRYDPETEFRRGQSYRSPFAL